MAAVPEGGEAEDKLSAPHGSVVSELHLSLQKVLLELRRATAQQPKEGTNGAEPLLRASRHFEHLVEALPAAVRFSMDAQLQEKLRALQEEDVKATEELDSVVQRAQALQAAVDQSWRQTCLEVCGDAVTVSDTPSAGGKGGVSGDADDSGDELPPHRGVRPRLQDLTQDRSRRFMEELEFLQCLANPEYVQWLAMNQYFEDPAFIEFLKYLSYWRRPPYIYHVIYPQALRMLELLQNPALRSRLGLVEARTLLQSQMMQHWASAEEVAVESGDLHPPASAAEKPRPAVKMPASAPADEATAEAQAGQQLSVLLDWTSLTDVLADKAWHEKVERINAPIYTVQHDATMIGTQYLARSFSGPELSAAVNKYQHFWAGPGTCDLAKVLGAQHTQPVPRGLPKETLEAFAPSPAAPKATPSGRGGRSFGGRRGQKRGRC